MSRPVILRRGPRLEPLRRQLTSAGIDPERGQVVTDRFRRQVAAGA